MMQNYFEIAHRFFPWMSPAMFAFFIFVLSLWTIIWKGLALWKAARKGSRNWFIALLVINTLGILGILYIFFFSKRGEKKE